MSKVANKAINAKGGEILIDNQKLSNDTLNTVLAEQTEAPALTGGADGSVNLYSSSLAHRFLLSETSFKNGEKVVSMGSSPKDNTDTLPIRKKGFKLTQRGLKRRQATNIRRAVRILHHHSPNSTLSFLTLTYGSDYPDDLTAKKHLDHFFKRLKRQYYDDKNFHYLWVAEKQKRGAIHYHIVLVDYIPKDTIDKCWRGVVQKWQRKNGFKEQVVYPNIKAISSSENIQKYLSKNFKRIGGYLTASNKQDKVQEIKGHIWGCSTLTRELCRGEKFKVESNSYEELDDIYNDIAYNGVLDGGQTYQHFIEGSDVKILIVQPINPSAAPEQQTEAPAPEQQTAPKEPKQIEAPGPCVSPLAAPEQTEAPALVYVLTPIYQDTSEYNYSLVLESLWGD